MRRRALRQALRGQTRGLHLSPLTSPPTCITPVMQWARHPVCQRRGRHQWPGLGGACTHRQLDHLPARRLRDSHARQLLVRRAILRGQCHRPSHVPHPRPAAWNRVQRYCGGAVGGQPRHLAFWQRHLHHAHLVRLPRCCYWLHMPASSSGLAAGDKHVGCSYWQEHASASSSLCVPASLVCAAPPRWRCW